MTHKKMETIIIQASKAVTLACLVLISATSLFLPGCSTGENALGTSTGEGEGQIQFSLGGISEGSEEDITKTGLVEETVYVPLDSSLAMACTLAPDPVSSTRTTSNMAAGTTYRLIAYNASNAIAGYADGVAGVDAPHISLPVGTYTIVAYSFNGATLPTAGTSISVPAGTDLLYFKKTGVLVSTGTSTAVSVVFDHKFNAVRVIPDTRALVLSAADASVNGIGKNVTAASATLGSSYPAAMAVSDGTLTAGTATTTAISWTAVGTKNPTSNEAYIYTNSGSSFTLTFTSISFGGGSASGTYAGKSVTFTQAMVVGTRYTVTTKFRKLCGAYVSTAGTSGSWKEFLCWNLTGYQTVPSSADPFTPSYLINGAYWQWGRSAVAASQPTNATGSDAGAISGWNTTRAADGSWVDGSKTANDPCPSGYRVPTNAQWLGVIANNTGAKVGSGTWTESNTNFTSAQTFSSNGFTTLLLPAAGFRLSTTGALQTRNIRGTYGSSTINGIAAAYALYFLYDTSATGSSLYTYDFARAAGLSVRCIAE